MIGTLIDGRYEVLSLLGQGGMGVVYEVKHRALEQRYALKVLHTRQTERSLTVRFEREARTASALGHPNIVQVFDLGRLPDDNPYLVMELLTGRPLNNVIYEDGPLTPSRTAELLIGVGSALDLAHARGVLHRDIKPDNLFLVQREDGTQFLKLVDFGVAAFTLLTSDRITDRGTWLGTPHYMAPEAAHDDLPDHRADVYSLGVVAYETMTGLCPWDDAPALHVLTRKLDEVAPPMSSSHLTFSPAVEAVVARCLEREPRARYASAGAFARALAAAAGVPTPTHTPSRPISLAPRSPSQRRALVVDDDPDFIALLSRHLERRDVEVVPASSAAEAMVALAEEDFDLVTVDGLLPDGTGLELIERMRAAGAEHRIVFVSAYWRDAGSEDLLRDLGVIAVLHKPLAAAELSDRIATEIAASTGRAARITSPDITASGITSRRSTSPDITEEQTIELEAEPEDDFETSLARMRLRYALTLKETLSSLERRVLELHNAPDLRMAAEEARTIAHKVQGTAGTYGFTKVSAIVRELEAWLLDLLGGKKLPTMRALATAGGMVRRALAATDEEIERTPASTQSSVPPATVQLATLLQIGGSGEARAAELRRYGVGLVIVPDATRAASVLGERAIDGLLVASESAAEALALLKELRSYSPALPHATLLLASSTPADRFAATYGGASTVLSANPRASEIANLARHAVVRRRAAMPTIIVLDDDPTFTSAIAQWLAEIGARVIRVHHPSWLAQTLDEHPPDLLLMDVSMPETSGLEICRMLRASSEWGELPIVFMTAHTDEHTKTMCFSSGGDDYVGKPVMKDELLARVRVRLDRARLYRDALDRDPVSGLLNRRALVAELGRLHERCHRREVPLAIAVVSLDGLADINAQGGDAAGDEALATLGALFSARLPAEALRARSRGGEFVVAIAGEDRDAADALIDGLSAEASALEVPLRLRGGAAVLPGDGEDVDAAIEAARRRSRLA
jgi:diguanylate cyclase (GGDEF)-like protein